MPHHAPADSMGQVTARHLCAGLLLTSGIVIKAAPILRYMQGWAAFEVEHYCQRKGWRYQQLSST